MELKFNELNWTEWKGERGREMAEHTENAEGFVQGRARAVNVVE